MLAAGSHKAGYALPDAVRRGDDLTTLQTVPMRAGDVSVPPSQSIDGLGRAEEATLLSGSSLLGVVYSARLLALGKLAVAQERPVAVPGAPLRVGWQVLESCHAEAVAVFQ